jgi:dTMP kinase
MMNKCTYIVIEGTEGCGKTTQTALLTKTLTEMGYKVLQTKEPGSPLSPITMALRGIMLDQQYDTQLTKTSRELISQAIRSIHLEKVVLPALQEYDFIIQDRGILSGLAYGEACGNDIHDLYSLTKLIAGEIDDIYSIYDHVIYLKGDVTKGLNVAKSSKQEFAAGDAIEAKGLDFMQEVSYNLDRFSNLFNTTNVTVDGKNIEQVQAEILSIIGLEKPNG